MIAAEGTERRPFIISAIFLTEGVGLHWASAGGIPHDHQYRFPASTGNLRTHQTRQHRQRLALLINLAVVGYLILELRRFPSGPDGPILCRSFRLCETNARFAALRTGHVKRVLARTI